MQKKSHTQDLLNGATMQLRVVGALLLREMQTSHGRENIGYLWAIIEPLIILCMFLTIYHYGGRSLHNGMNLVSFLATGIVTFLTLRKMAGNISGATDANKGLMLHSQVTPLDTMLARVILQSATYIVLLTVIILGAWLFGVGTLPHDFFGVMIALAAVSFLGASLGIFQGAIVTIFPLVTYVMRPIWRFMFFTSCVFYALHDLPLGLRKLVAYNPIANGIELLREAYFLGFDTPINGYGYMLKWCLVCIFTGLLVERLYRHREIET